MKRTIFILLLFFSFSFAQEKYTGQTIEQIMELPEEKIDLGIALLVLAKDVYPNMNIKFFDYALDYMANQIESLLQGQTDPEARIGIINTYLYRSGWWNDSVTFTYDLDDLEATEKDNQFLNGYLATKKGSCATMPMLHLVLADRLGWPIYAVRSPKHIFCRYMDDNLKNKNIEATCGGGFIRDKRYITDTGIPDKAIKNGVYLRTLSKKEYIATMMLNNARYFHEQENNLKKAIYYTGFALLVDSTLSPAHWNLGRYYYFFAHDLETEMIQKIKNLNDLFSAELLTLQTKSQQVNSFTPKVPSLFDYQNEINQDRIPQPTNPFQMDLSSILGTGSHISPMPKINNTHRQNISNQEMNNLLLKASMVSENIKQNYVPLIKEALERSEWHKTKAEELGIVLKFPETFFIKQSESIERYKKTGKY